MTKMRYLPVLFFIMVFTPCFSQETETPGAEDYSIPDSLTYKPIEITGYIREKCPDDNDFVYFLFFWMTHNIEYSNTIIDSLQNEDLVCYTLKTKTGKCKHFSATMTTICHIAGIEAYSVLGYIKINGRVGTRQDHAWNIIKTDNVYFLYDPTWDSGKETFKYFRKTGDEFIKDHMPYDPMMQLKFYPIEHKEFFKGETEGKLFFDYNKEFGKYRVMSDKEQLRIMLDRAFYYGLNYRKLKFLKRRLTYFVIKNTEG